MPSDEIFGECSHCGRGQRHRGGKNYWTCRHCGKRNVGPNVIKDFFGGMANQLAGKAPVAAKKPARKAPAKPAAKPAASAKKAPARKASSTTVTSGRTAAKPAAKRRTAPAAKTKPAAAAATATNGHGPAGKKESAAMSRFKKLLHG